jgi:putative salt-induced outer membrane protein YdiY
VRSKPLRFDLEAGLGWQHAKRLDDSRYQTVVNVLAENLRWQIDEQWEFRQDASSYRTEYEKNLELNAELRRRFTQNISLKLGLEWQHLSPVPEGVEKNDMVSMLSLIYSM